MQNHHRRKVKQLSLSLSCLTSFFFCPAQVDCQATGWTMTVSAQRLDSYLNYSGSPLAPIVRTSIYYNQAGQSTHYEDIFYSQQQAIGCRQYHALPATPGTAGVIAITTLSNNDQQQGYAAANAALRTYLDLALQKSSVRLMTVAPEYFSNLIQALGQYGFQPLHIVPDQPFKAKVVLEVMSGQSGPVQYLFYDD